MIPLQECLICGASIWPLITEHTNTIENSAIDEEATTRGGYLCFVHRRLRMALALDRRWVQFKRQVDEASDKRTTDWCVGQPHAARQCAANHAPLPWRPKFDDILRRAMYWLLEDDGSEAA